MNNQGVSESTPKVTWDEIVLLQQSGRGLDVE